MNAPAAAESAHPRAIPPPVRKPPDGIRPLGPVDVAPLEAVLDSLTEKVWQLEDGAKPNRFACFHSTRHVVFRFCSFEDVRDSWSNPAWKIFGRSLLPVMEQATSAYGFAEPVYPRVMFASLAPGRRIDVHTDGKGAVRHAHKIHIPVRTSPAAVLTVGGVERHLRRGHAYEVNNILPHGARNGGREERIHFIFEAFDGHPAETD